MAMFTNFNLTSSSKPNPRGFEGIERKIRDEFDQIEALKIPFAKAQEAINKAQSAFNDFVNQNAGIEVANDTVENRTIERRLNNRKWFTVIADALVSIPAVQLLFGETLGLSLTTFVASVIGCVVSFAFLRLAIDYKIDSENESSNAFLKYWQKYSHIIPLMIIPVLSLFLLHQSWGNPENFLWLVFLAAAFMLNLKVVSFSPQYKLMANSKEARKQQNVLVQTTEKAEKQRDTIVEKIQRHKTKIGVLAGDLLKEWRKFDDSEKPPLTLSPDRRSILNNNFYFEQILPIPAIEIVTMPAGNTNLLPDFWESTQPHRINKGGEVKGAALNGQTQENPHTLTQPTAVAPPPPPERLTPTEQEPAIAPSFGEVINDNLKYV